jgi:diadenosine tetraphosphate (Ap4A) HIT family hydrolase
MESSPFFDVPSSDWVASNRSAFAIRDKYPVTEGHTLVIPRRLIGTWWEASPDERSDLIALVDEVRAALDEEFRPDGYNVGFNAGTAAGQTVDHLHIHVIPRRAGDMPDPRGGVRHVIPERGNYLARPADAQPPPPPLVTVPTVDAIELADGVERHLLPFLQEALADPRFDRIDVVVSFVKQVWRPAGA